MAMGTVTRNNNTETWTACRKFGDTGARTNPYTAIIPKRSTGRPGERPPYMSVMAIRKITSHRKRTASEAIPVVGAAATKLKAITYTPTRNVRFRSIASSDAASRNRTRTVTPNTPNSRKKTVTRPNRSYSIMAFCLLERRRPPAPPRAGPDHARTSRPRASEPHAITIHYKPTMPSSSMRKSAPPAGLGRSPLKGSRFPDGPGRRAPRRNPALARRLPDRGKRPPVSGRPRRA